MDVIHWDIIDGEHNRILLLKYLQLVDVYFG